VADRRRLGRWFRCRRSTAALEFAIAAPIFVLLLGSVIENGVLLFTQAALDNATRDASRLILTGQVQQGAGAGAFEAKVCAELGNLVPCSSLQYNVQAAGTFSALNVSVQSDSSGNMTGTQFNPGTPGQDVVVQVGYNRPYIVPLVGQYMSVNGSKLLVSTVVFQNEPYIP
jgi:Flp pilus assembly protein TadG